MNWLKQLLARFRRSEFERALEACKGDCIPMRKGEE